MLTNWISPSDSKTINDERSCRSALRHPGRESFGVIGPDIARTDLSQPVHSLCRRAVPEWRGVSIGQSAVLLPDKDDLPASAVMVSPDKLVGPTGTDALFSGMACKPMGKVKWPADTPALLADAIALSISKPRLSEIRITLLVATAFQTADTMVLPGDRIVLSCLEARFSCLATRRRPDAEKSRAKCRFVNWYC